MTEQLDVSRQVIVSCLEHALETSVFIADANPLLPVSCAAAGNGSLALVCRTVMPIARQADGLWVYLDSSEPEQRMPLKQLQQQHGHEVVGALLITAVQPKDDSCNVASRLPGRPTAAASTSIRSVQVQHT